MTPADAGGSFLQLTREQVLAHRRRAGLLDARRPWGEDALRRAAWAGLTDSTPRAALHSLHARVAGTTTEALDDQVLVQLWGPRFSTYVVAEQDRAAFSLGRLSPDPARRRLAVGLADRLEAFLQGREMPYGQAGRALGVHPSQLRYAATTGRVLLRWDGARPPVVRTVPAPEVEPDDARRELVRRYLHVLGPGTVDGLARWAGLYRRPAAAAFAALAPVLVGVRTPAGDGWVLADDEASYRAEPDGAPAVRLLPSGDAYYLAWGPGRELLVGDPRRRDELWTSRVWPGAVLLDGEVAGVWRRAEHRLVVRPWRPLSPAEREAVADEAASLPLPGVAEPATVRWEV